MLPDGWKEIALQSISAKSISYGIVQTGNSEVGTIPCFRVVDLTKKYIKKEEMIKTTEDISNSYRRTILAEGELLFALRGEIAKAFLVTKEFVGLNITRGIARISPSKEVLPNFLFFALQSPYYKKKCIQHVGGSALQEISITELRKSTILLPPLPEQEKIAAILSTWDKAISTTDALLENSCRQKKALMQQLLTGKRRLPGFKGEWKNIRVGNVIREERARNRGSKVTRVLSVTNQKGFVLPEEQFSKRVASDNIENYKIIKRGQFGYNPSRLNIGSFGRLDKFEEGILSPLYVIFSLKDTHINSDFFLSWMQAGETRQRIKRSTQGSVRESVSFDALADFPLLLPPLDEQRAIAAVLDAADREISLLKQKAARLREEKKALMQQLLTGKRRVRA